MIPQPTLDQIGRADLERLVTDQVHEGRTLDYKRDIALSNDEHRRELARDVSSFANAAGGDLIFGVEEAKDEDGKNLGYPEKVVGVECPNFDDTKQRIESIIRENIDPRIHGVAIRKIDGFDRGPVIVVRIPRSWNAPHMVSYKSQTHFYSRNSSGKHPLDVREIKATFLEGTEQAARVRRFRDERVGRIIAGETPVPLDTKDAATLVVHLVPVGLDSSAALDVVALSKDLRRMQPLGGSAGFHNRLNLDGYLTHVAPSQTPQFCYLLAFRTGAFEGVDLMPIFRDGYPMPHFFAGPIERSVLGIVSEGLNVIRSFIASPVSLHVGLLGAKGVRIRHGDIEKPWERDVAIDRDPLLLPDVLVEDQNAELPALLKPIFDALWQSSGWERSFGYDAQGNWDERAHRG